MIYRQFYDTNTLLRIYLTCIRPQLEYVCQLWYPNTTKGIQSLESVQHTPINELSIGKALLSAGDHPSRLGKTNFHCHKWGLYELGERTVSQPVCAKEVKNWPPSANQGLSNLSPDPTMMFVPFRCTHLPLSHHFSSHRTYL